jgi:hypothetical protein
MTLDTFVIYSLRIVFLIILAILFYYRKKIKYTFVSIILFLIFIFGSWYYYIHVKWYYWSELAATWLLYILYTLYYGIIFVICLSIDILWLLGQKYLKLQKIFKIILYFVIIFIVIYFAWIKLVDLNI